MVKILMMSAKKVITSYILSMTSQKKNCHMTQIILWMWLCDLSLVTLVFV